MKPALKTLLLSTRDMAPGAARPALQLHQGLRRMGVDSRLLVQTKQGDDASVLGPRTKAQKVQVAVRPTLNALPLQMYPQRRSGEFSAQWLPDALAGQAADFGADVVNIHWICEGFMQVETVARLRGPVVWTLHDMWAFTGGCHNDNFLDQTCGRYKDSCGRCPQIGSAHERDLSRLVWRRKRRAFDRARITVVASSRWLADCARASSLFAGRRVEIIPLGLDTEVFRPMDKTWARRALNLPLDKPLIAFGAVGAVDTPNKGIGLLRAALHHLHARGACRDANVVIFGASRPAQDAGFGFAAHYAGRLHDPLSVALLYGATDVTVVPSYQEAWGQTASESLACGTPVVAWDATGPRDVVVHRKSGYLARPYDAEDLAAGMAWVLADPARREELSSFGADRARREWTLDAQAQRYRALFEEVCSEKAGDK